MKATLHNVQALRLVAALMVLVSHLQHEVPSVRGLDASHYVPWTPVWFAGGVDIFFVISGFIMYLIAAGSFGEPHAAREFLRRRLIRIVPPYWFFTTAMVAAMILLRDHVAHAVISPGHVVASYLFLPWVNPYGQFYPVLILGWTLNFEMLFYVIFALSLNFSRRLGLAMIATLIGGLAVVGALVDFRPTALAGSPIASWSNPIVLEFLFGIALAWVFARGLRWSRTTGVLVMAIGCGAMLAVQGAGVAGHYWPARCLWMGLPALALCAGATLIERTAEPGRVQRALEVGGDASFALYLSHPFSLAIIAAAWPLLGIASPLAYVAIAGAGALLCAVLLHLWLEKPVMAYLGRVLMPGRRSGPSPATAMGARDSAALGRT
jgi:peptidoglycan/LPS O-acetylase OafA/YrhL